jgi:hypothetical protein
VTDKDPSNDKDRDEFKRSAEVLEVAIKNGAVALWNFLKGIWKSIERQHPFVQLIFTLPVAYAIRLVFTPLANWFYTIFWEMPVPIRGSLHISGLPLPLSWMIYIIVLLLILTMASNYHNKKQLQELQSELSE